MENASAAPLPLPPLQTASGKTHTIEGCLTPPQVKALASGAFPTLFAPSSPLLHDGGAGGATETLGSAAEIASRAGLIHRLVHGLFLAIDAAGADTSFKLSCQLIEIYNEGLRDLLQKGITAETRRVGGRTGVSVGGGTSTGSGGSGAARADAAPPDTDVSTVSRSVDDTATAESGAAGTEEDDGGDYKDGGGAAAGAGGGGGSGGTDADERLRLLRSAVSSGKTTGSDTPLGADSDALQIREDPDRGVFVAGAAQLPVTCARHVFEALALGAAHRSTAATGMNERSSRSHSVLQLYVTQRRLDNMTTVRSTLTIVDLAGSERVSAA